MATKLNPAHLAIPVTNLEKCRAFYRNILGLEEGRSSENWVDFGFFGHQLVLHKIPTASKQKDENTNPVDGKSVPVPHFGVVLDWDDWHEFFERLNQSGIEFVIEPYIRFIGETGEQTAMFFLDPDGNALEFKTFKDQINLFAK